MKLIFALLLLLLAGASAAQECTCHPVKTDAHSWARSMYQNSTYVFYGRVESIAPPVFGSNETRDQSTVSVLRNYKGSFSGGQIRNFDCGTGVLPGDRVMFFLDGYQRIRSCSTYPKGLTDEEIKDAVVELSLHGP